MIKFNTLEKHREKHGNLYLGFIALAVFLAFVFFGLIQGTLRMTELTFRLLKEYWIWILVIMIVLFFLKRFLFRRKPLVQEMRIIK